MRHTLHLLSLALGLAFLAGACSLFNGSHSSGDEHSGSTRSSNLERVPDSLLAYVPANKRSDIEDARAAEAKARDESASAQRTTEMRKDQLKISEKELDIAQAELKKTELAVGLAENGTQADLDRAHQNVKDAQALVDAARARITWRERGIDLGKADEDCARAKQSLAAARVELAKARAVQGLDRPEAKKIETAGFEREVRLDEESLSVCKVKAEARVKDTQAARDIFHDKSKVVPASYKKDWDDKDLEKSDAK